MRDLLQRKLVVTLGCLGLALLIAVGLFGCGLMINMSPDPPGFDPGVAVGE